MDVCSQSCFHSGPFGADLSFSSRLESGINGCSPLFFPETLTAIPACLSPSRWRDQLAPGGLNDRIVQRASTSHKQQIQSSIYSASVFVLHVSLSVCLQRKQQISVWRCWSHFLSLEVSSLCVLQKLPRRPLVSGHSLRHVHAPRLLEIRSQTEWDVICSKSKQLALDMLTC